MNIDLLNFFYGLSANNIVVYISAFLSYIFVYLIPIILIIWLIFYNKRKMYSFSLIFLSTITTWIMSEFMKMIFAIQRPIAENPVIIENGFSFPSQHAAITMVVAITVLSINKKLGYFLLVVSFLVGISRLTLGVHYPTDVLGGFVLGWLVGFLFIRFFKKI